jgi:Protein of unknown function/Domain of unknown function (DUF1835)
MKITHVVPGSSAAGSLIAALQMAGRPDQVLTFRDDLSCGPIASDEPGSRQRWWQDSAGWQAEDDEGLHQFWTDALNLKDKIVLWFSRHSAREFAFRLSWAWHMRGHRYDAIDVTGLSVPFRKPDGSEALTLPLQTIGMIPADGFLTLLGTERPVLPAEDAANSDTWSRLMTEDAPFRVVTPRGMESAPVDYFDHQLLEQADSEWRKINRVIGEAMVANMEPYRQVGDWMLYVRLLALIEQGKLIADGDAHERFKCSVRLPAN